MFHRLPENLGFGVGRGGGGKLLKTSKVKPYRVVTHFQRNDKTIRPAQTNYRLYSWHSGNSGIVAKRLTDYN